MSILSKRLCGGILLSAISSFCVTSVRAESTILSGDWSGLQLGGHVGVVQANPEFYNDLTNENLNFSPSGVTGGAHVGFNLQQDNLLVGVEAALSLTDLSETLQSVVVPAHVTFTSDMNWLARFTGRVGWAHEDWLFYVRGGYALADITSSGHNSDIGGRFSDTTQHHGYTLGAGLEWKLTENVVAGAEYNFVDLQPRSVSGLTTVSAPYTSSNINADIHAVTVRMSWLFGTE